MANLVCVILILLNVICQGVHTQENQDTTPPPLIFDCVNGKIANINQTEDGQDSLLVEYGSNGKLCHITEDTCKPNLQDKATLHVIYDKAEKDKTSQFVAGTLYRYELKCLPGYEARASAKAFEIISTPAQPYIHQDKTQTPPGDAITLQIFKGSKILSNEKVHVGDELKLKITAKAPSSFKPINCTAHKTDSNSQNREKHLLWNNNNCHASDNAIMKNNWKKINERSIEIDMYAFRFIDSLSVTIECSAYVCPLGDSNCGQSIKNCMTTTLIQKTTLSTTQTTLSKKVSSPVITPTVTVKPGDRRRRRNINQNERMEKIASTSFTIVDIKDNSNGCTGLSSNKLQFFTILLVCICISGRNSSN